MDLQPYTLDGKQCHGAWVEIILFLQSLLSLETIYLNGVFSNKVDEVWCSQNPGEHYYVKSHEVLDFRLGDSDSASDSSGHLSLKHCMERFVVNGGTFPPALPQEAQKAGGWHPTLSDALYANKLCWFFSWRFLHRADDSFRR